jgi:hypothetical protein
LVKFKLILTLLLVLTGFTSRGASITLAWEASESPNVVGYKIYSFGYEQDYRTIEVVGNKLTQIIDDLEPWLTYHFYVVATDDSGVESDASNIVIYTVPDLSFEQRIKKRTLQPQNATIRGGFKLSN